MKKHNFLQLIATLLALTFLLCAIPLLGTSVGAATIMYGGDANGDGDIGVKDIVLLRRYLATLDYNTGISTVTVAEGADVDGDGEITSKDLAMLRRYLAGYDYDTETDEESETKNENVIANEHDSLIQSSNALAGGVQAYFTDSSRVYFTVENREMTMNYARNKQVKQLVESIKNTEGVSYIQNTMDVFVRMTDGGTYYASNSTKSAEANLLRLGYYYYEALFEYQNFVLEDLEIENEKQINLSEQVSGISGMKKTVDNQTGGMVFTIADDKDPQFI